MYLGRNVKDVKPKCMLCKVYVVSSSQEVTVKVHYTKVVVCMETQNTTECFLCPLYKCGLKMTSYCRNM
jgi:hypothetical protein